MVACGTLKGRYSLDNSSKPQTLNPNPRKGWHSQKSESWLAWEDSTRGTVQLRARDTAWSSGQKGSYTAGGNISSCEITPRDQMDLLCSTIWNSWCILLINWFHSHNKECVLMWAGWWKSWFNIFLFKLNANKVKVMFTRWRKPQGF